MQRTYPLESAASWTKGQWNELISQLPGGHILQTTQWARLKEDVGWRPEPWIWRNVQGQPVAAAMVLQRSLSQTFPFNHLNILYVPKGPILDWSNLPLAEQVLTDLEQIARERKAIFIKIDPDVWLGTGEPGTAEEIPDPTGLKVLLSLETLGWRESPEQIQFKNTVMLDLSASEASLLAAMKQKTRYNINLAVRKGVSIRLGEEKDFPMLYRMYAETSLRDGFIIRDEAYYTRVWREMLAAGMAQPFVAEVEGEEVAALVLFLFAGRAYYFYGMSRDRHRDKMPNYLLQWEAIRYAKARGCQVYDFWGAPNQFNGSDSMSGVYRFKRGLGGTLWRGCGAVDRVIWPAGYALYTRVLPEILQWMRQRGKKKISQEISP